MRALITGSQGFVGRYMREELEENGYETVGMDLQPGENTIQADLLNAGRLSKVVYEIRPDIVIHLAGQANAACSWKFPQRTMEMNVIGSINLMESVRALDPSIRMVMIGSSHQYGALGEKGKLVREDFELKPQTPYAISKTAQEEMARIYVDAYRMNICMTRSFNHCGAGQKEGFLIPDFAAGIVRVEKGFQPALRVGNLAARRDFTHVRDVVRAYRLIAEKGMAGEAYNVGSGKTHSAQEILDNLRAMAKCHVPVEQAPDKMRPSDTAVICCDYSKITKQTGWEPEISMEMILQEILEEWRVRI